MSPTEGKTKVRRALLSVSDKTGIVEFGKVLSRLGVEVVSTGGTRRNLDDAGVSAIDIAELTGFPEMMDGRIKTLHPKVHGGILSVRDNENHKNAMRIHQIPPVDLVAVNLYPFERAIADGADYDTAIENIDIGGPAMIRSAAKNHRFVTVIVDPGDYEEVAERIEKEGEVPFGLRKKLAAKAFARTANYDAAISNWFAKSLDYNDMPWRSVSGRLVSEMRYGENPHQWAGFYADGSGAPGVATAQQVQGKELSYNNINDTDAAFELVCEFEPGGAAAVAIVKHANPCGVGRDADMIEAYRKALRCDPVSAFGGIVAVNSEITKALAEEIVKVFTEVVIAPSVTPGALAVFETKKNLRVLVTDKLADPRRDAPVVKSVTGGFLMQSRDNGSVEDCELTVVTSRQPTDEEMGDMLMAAKVAKHVKSNAIVYVKDGATVGVGAGQMSRVDSTVIAHRKATEAAKAADEDEPLTSGSVVASDAFFPFPDGLMAAVEAGATAVIQPGGSIRDDDVIAAADEAGIAMVFTGMRHFRH